MPSIAHQIHRFFEEQNISPEAKLLLACSGGLDSVVLFQHLLDREGSFAVAHCNFSLRADESDDDEAFVRNLAETHHIDFYSKRFQTKEYADQSGVSIQMAARSLRYAYFEELRTTKGFDYILTAHHLNDSFETFLINLGRGTGIQGLTGIPSQKEYLLRPMHRCSRTALAAYAKKAGLAWREDSSNSKIEYQRNQLRHQVLPKLLESKEGYAKGFAKSMDLVQEASQFAEAQARVLLQDMEVRQSDGAVKLYTKALLKQPGFGYALHQWLRAFGEFDIHALQRALLSPAKQYFDSVSHELIVEEDYIWLQPKQSLPQAVQLTKEDEHVLFGEYQFSFGSQHDKPDEQALKHPQHAYLDMSKLRFPLRLRTLQDGDSFVPFGMNGSKNISDFLSEQGLNVLQKSRVPLLLSGDDIVWVCGYRINDNFKVTDKSNSLYFGRFLK